MALASAHARELIDLPEETIRGISCPVCGIGGEKDPERKFLERMQGVVGNYELTVIPKAGHNGAGDHVVFKETLVGFMERMRDSSKGP